jgi:dipeptidase E
MGGGGFSMEPENPLLDEYVLRLAGKERPRVCFVGTASGDAATYVVRFYEAFAQLPCRPCHLPLFNPPTADLRGFVLEQDVIYVGGGNTKNLLALWRAWDLDAIFREAWEQGIILAGISAGCICWFAEGITDSIPGTLSVLPCLGYLPGSACPHYDSEPERRPSFHRFLGDGRIGEGYAVEDGAALHFVDDRLERVVASRPAARAYRMRRTPQGVVEEAQEAVYLGESPP